jgi:hypothetical protein
MEQKGPPKRRYPTAAQYGAKASRPRRINSYLHIVHHHHHHHNIPRHLTYSHSHFYRPSYYITTPNIEVHWLSTPASCQRISAPRPLSLPELITSFLSIPRQILGWSPNISHNHIRPHHFQLIIHNNSTPSGEIKNSWSYNFTPLHTPIFMVWCLIKDRDDFGEPG